MIPVVHHPAPMLAAALQVETVDKNGRSATCSQEGGGDRLCSGKTYCDTVIADRGSASRSDHVDEVLNGRVPREKESGGSAFR